jgi:hypothetical protein
VRRSRTAFALGVVVLPLVLGGCSGDDPEPKFAPTEATSLTVSSSPSPSPSVTDSSSPKAAQAEFIDAYFGEFSDAIPTGQPAEFLAMSSGKCQSCQVLVDNLTAAYVDGGHVEGGHWAVSSARFVRSGRIGFIWNVNVATTREHWFDGNGQEIKVIRPSTQHLAVALLKHGNGWQVREMRLR